RPPLAVSNKPAAVAAYYARARRSHAHSSHSPYQFSLAVRTALAGDKTNPVGAFPQPLAKM
ncbi:hypothetical protein ACFMF8_005387, partial [Escherichia coli]